MLGSPHSDYISLKASENKIRNTFIHICEDKDFFKIPRSTSDISGGKKMTVYVSSYSIDSKPRECKPFSVWNICNILRHIYPMYTLRYNIDLNESVYL